MTKTSRHGFTLAEVLTTLMVIGVVAAMTIPTLLNSTNDQQTKVAYKKAVSVLSQGTQLMIAKEVSCNPAVTDSATLAKCMTQVISGTVGTTAGTDDNQISTTDGMVYKFYYNTSKSGGADLAAACGDENTLANDADGWAGKGACAVVVDVNGVSKGETDFDDWNGSSLSDTTGISYSGTSQPSDQFALSLTSAGAKPIYVSGSITKGYEYMYGNTTQPYSN